MLLFGHSIAFQWSLCLEFRSVSYLLNHSLVQRISRNYHSLESGFNPLYCFFFRSRTNAASAKGQSLWYVLQARMALDGSGYLSRFVQFNIAKFVSCATRLFAELDGFFWPSQIFNNSFSATTSWICPNLSSSSKITSCAIPSILRSTLNSGSSLSQQVT